MSIVTNEVPEIVGLIHSNYGVAPSNLFTESSPILWRLVFPPEGEASEFLLPQLPNLPSLPSVADPFESDGFDSNMNVVPVRKKLKTEIGEVNKSLHESKSSTHWLDDVVCTGSDQPQFSDEDVVCREIDSYLMESQIPSEQCKMVAE